ncbi:MAG: 4Fe-4S dicluster domain-containing protein [Lachnospiraceae bacterium]|jgi:NADH-quinone oxidoreductase subunit G|nr:4Fe-4S dicluster domain-containing protein [Lachnospiraceae bacterium]MCI8871516.1 4Fe-4S dicluster domain-containing protein [Lachnospiraceae bacterium]GFI29683.1 NADP-reducing hydrogenase subunit HndD [Lachnospiraceae bacterium]
MEKYMIIDGERVSFADEKNILAVIRKAGIILPTFCYYSDLSIYGACRMCVVEDQWGGIIASCSTPPKHQMEIRTNTPQLYYHRKRILELLLAAHCRDCTTCEKNGKCKLQELATRFGIPGVRFENTNPIRPIDTSSKAIVRNPNKCILCGDCVRVCSEIQHVGAIDFAHRGSKMEISTAFGRDIADTNCVSCGQCAAVCPTGAITIKRDSHDVWEAIHNPKKRVVVQIAPAVRVAIGEAYGYEPGENTIGKLVASLRKLGIDAIFDTSVGADLTIMEESEELLEALEEKDRKYPLFTSCCPGWIRFVETQYPHLMQYVSTSKSPMEMFGAVIKEYYRKQDKKEGKETVSVAIMPCTAKKFEASREEFKRKGIPDVDYVLTSEEVITMLQEIGIRFDRLEPEAYDMPFSIFSGAGVIFGATGGVTEAAVRRVVEDKSPKALKEIEFIGARGMEGVKICELPFGERQIRIAVVSGLGNADHLLQKIESGEEHFDFVEVMACPGGCVAGAGQPFARSTEKRMRAEGLYKNDKAMQIKRSEENPLVESLYKDLLKNREHDLLHVDYLHK